MFYEERIIDGRMYWRNTPTGDWVKMSHEGLVAKLSTTRLEGIKEGMTRSAAFIQNNYPLTGPTLAVAILAERDRVKQPDGESRWEERK